MKSPAEFIGQRVGRYTIISHLASGGMAELFIARQEAVGGFEKNIVLKMLQERYAQNPRVVQMFLDEARLAAKLNHQNIVHVYDVDEADGIRYIAMEYIHGETVTDVVRRSIDVASFLPLEHAVQIAADTAAGLAYAHDRREADGRLVRIVHRDVSPSNILVTYEGVTKIVDFGIARIQDQIREESGMRPGKVSYMAPEQVRGEGADHRSDIFSLGVVLYEITVGKRLWRGPAEQVMRRIVEEQVPPPTYVRRAYPPGLELIVMKALEKRPSDRQQSAAELHHELLEFLEESGLRSGPRRLAHYMKALFAPEGSVSAPGVEQARDAAGSAAGVPTSAPERDDSEELDFDRRAPLVMRVEAADEDDDSPGFGSELGLAAPLPGRRPPERPGPGRSARALADFGSATPGLEAPGDDDPFPPVLPVAGGHLGPASRAPLGAGGGGLDGGGLREVRSGELGRPEISSALAAAARAGVGRTPPPAYPDAAPVEARLAWVGSGPTSHPVSRTDVRATSFAGAGAPTSRNGVSPPPSPSVAPSASPGTAHSADFAPAADARGTPPLSSEREPARPRGGLSPAVWIVAVAILAAALVAVFALSARG